MFVLLLNHSVQFDWASFMGTFPL